MSNLKLFDSKQIRTVWNEDTKQWFFVVADVIQVLTDTTNPTEYIKKMRKRDMLLSQGWGQIVTPLSIREELTEEWKIRGVKEKPEYAILTAEISKATLGIISSEHRQLKGLKNQIIRDHMTDLELRPF